MAPDTAHNVLLGPSCQALANPKEWCGFEAAWLNEEDLDSATAG